MPTGLESFTTLLFAKFSLLWSLNI